MQTHSKIHRLLLTGAAGHLGAVLRDRLQPFADVLRVSDIACMEPASSAAQEVVICDLADKAAVHALVQGCDAIVHMGGVSVEKPFEEVLEANVKGIYHVYEAARCHGVRRVVFASSNHVTGFYKQTEKLDAGVQRRPDGYYGLSKSFGEDLAMFYFDRYGIETVSIRIGTSCAEPANRRMLSTWLSYDDLLQLIVRALFTPGVGHTVVYGASANRDVWWDNHEAARLGYVPKDSSEPWRSVVEAQPALEAGDPMLVYQGGFYTAQGPFEASR
ncbi:NAD-dependent epimerase/dehydratase family protein [Comamonas composti]|uniref:NAD-dependent epimerase/dehydratase family protein n=1 Tax=Comamonas composti TaxID=408558 RepID=UPI000421D1B3|nr:NAD(P)-dependent oxidoreductase [Comamonas composti]